MEDIKERIQFVINQFYKGNESALCRDTGISQSTLNSILRTDRRPTLGTLEKITKAKSFKINADWLYTGLGEQSIHEGDSQNACPNCAVLHEELLESRKKITLLQDQLLDMHKQLLDIHINHPELFIVPTEKSKAG